MTPLSLLQMPDPGARGGPPPEIPPPTFTPFVIALVIVGLLVFATIAARRLIDGHAGQRKSFWIRHRELLLIGPTVGGIVAAIGAASWLRLFTAEPIGKCILPIAGFVVFIPIGARALVEFGERRTWIWALRNGPTVRRFAGIAALVVLLGVVGLYLVT